MFSLLFTGVNCQLNESLQFTTKKICQMIGETLVEKSDKRSNFGVEILEKGRIATF